jgi:hypothetical protein
MIDRASLVIARGSCSSQWEQEVLTSHLEALDAISRLRSALDAVLSALNAVDDGEFEDAVEGLMRMQELQPPRGASDF